MRIHSNPDIDWSQKSFAALQSIASKISTQDSLYRFSQRGTYGNRCLDQDTREYVSSTGQGHEPVVSCAHIHFAESETARLIVLHASHLMDKVGGKVGSSHCALYQLGIMVLKSVHPFPRHSMRLRDRGTRYTIVFARTDHH